MIAKALLGRLQREGFLVGERGKGNRIIRDRFTSSGLANFFATIALPEQDDADDLARSAKAMTITEDKVWMSSYVLRARPKLVVMACRHYVSLHTDQPCAGCTPKEASPR